MKNLLKNKKTFKRLLILVVIGYVASIFISQQKTLNAYRNGQEYNAQKLAEEQEYNESLLAMQENINSSEYIEQIAREKLYMYLPNEKVYIDRSKQWGYE